MPQLGETVAEGKITKWFKSAGDAVKPGDNLFEIETDKVSMEVPSITTGTLAEIKVQAGETALVGAVVAVIAGEGGAAANAPAAKAPPPHRSRRRHKLRRSRASASPAAIAAVHAPRGRAADPARSAYADLDPFFEVRTPVAQFRSGENSRAAPSSRRWRAGSPARTASISRACRAPARAAASSPPMSSPPSPRAAAAPRRWHRAPARRR